MPPKARALRRRLSRAPGAAAWLLTRLARRLEEPERSAWRTLAGDRVVEWAWVLANLRAEPGRVLDLGAGNGFLSQAAAFRGHHVVAVDLAERDFVFDADEIEYLRGDFNELELEPGSFDQVLCCSTLEHFGLGGRYGGVDKADADLAAASRIAELLRPGATLVLTMPVGRDDVFPPHHRVYGRERLPLLLDPFSIHAEEYRVKRDSGRWERATRAQAVDVEGSSTFYALGLYVLSPR